jgi:FkbM family methyltransferase
MLNSSLLILRCKKILRILSNLNYFKAFFSDGVIAAVEHEPIISSELQTIIDVGGNKGQFSLASRSIATHAEIYLFEPLQSPFAIAKRVFKSDARVHVFNFAIGSSEGECDMNVSMQDDSSSIHPITKRQVEIFPGTKKVGIERIKITTLQKAVESFNFKSPALLKIDVQGYEYEVLQSGESILGFFELIYCELSFVELYEGQILAHHIIQWLYDHGFFLIGVYNLSNDLKGAAVQGDFLFKNNNKKLLK